MTMRPSQKKKACEHQFVRPVVKPDTKARPIKGWRRLAVELQCAGCGSQVDHNALGVKLKAVGTVKATSVKTAKLALNVRAKLRFSEPEYRKPPEVLVDGFYMEVVAEFADGCVGSWRTFTPPDVYMMDQVGSRKRMESQLEKLASESHVKLHKMPF